MIATTTYTTCSCLSTYFFSLGPEAQPLVVLGSVVDLVLVAVPARVRLLEVALAEHDVGGRLVADDLATRTGCSLVRSAFSASIMTASGAAASAEVDYLV